MVCTFQKVRLARTAFHPHGLRQAADRSEDGHAYLVRTPAVQSPLGEGELSHKSSGTKPLSRLQ